MASPINLSDAFMKSAFNDRRDTTYMGLSDLVKAKEEETPGGSESDTEITDEIISAYRELTPDQMKSAASTPEGRARLMEIRALLASRAQGQSQ